MVLATPLPRLDELVRPRRPPHETLCPLESFDMAFRCAAFGTSRVEAAEVDGEFFGFLKSVLWFLLIHMWNNGPTFRGVLTVTTVVLLHKKTTGLIREEALQLCR